MFSLRHAVAGYKGGEERECLGYGNDYTDRTASLGGIGLPLSSLPHHLSFHCSIPEQPTCLSIGLGIAVINPKKVDSCAGPSWLASIASSLEQVTAGPFADIVASSFVLPALPLPFLPSTCRELLLRRGRSTSSESFNPTAPSEFLPAGTPILVYRLPFPLGLFQPPPA